MSALLTVPQPTRWEGVIDAAGTGGTGEVWTRGRRLAQVRYQLHPVDRDVIGRLTLLDGDWWALLGLQEWGLRLLMEDRQELPFIIRGCARPALTIRALP
jgi:hypothetical protein